MRTPAAEPESETAAGAQPLLVPLEYPGPVVRAIPGFTIGIPIGWEISEAAGLLFGLSSPADPDGRRVAGYVRHSRVSPSSTLDAHAAVSWQQLAVAYPGIEVAEERLVSLVPVQHVREATLRAEADEEPLTMVDSFLFGPVVDQPTLDLFQFTFLIPTAIEDQVSPTCVTMLASLEFT